MQAEATFSSYILTTNVVNAKIKLALSINKLKGM